ncbi:MAG TPA: transcription elongation factor Spt5 [Candidatus Pacearchaeota archaeon]|nr:MAG: transcription elongation factor Spt5 [Candidatus Pacearchaeota archaeon ex4484_31]HDI03142.1 transcription elongation factor Spt5 [Candidatus Pacearchaeota archaeon]
MIFAVKVITNKESQAAEFIAERAKKKNLNIFSVTQAPGLRGYVFVESTDSETVKEAITKLPYVKGMLTKKLSYEDIEPVVKPSPETISIEKNDIVEILTEPFKREKAKVVRVDKAKGKVTIELLEATVPIPIVVDIDNVKVIRRTKEE